MDFFSHQEKAHRKTFQLLLYLFLTLLTITLLIYGVILTAMVFLPKTVSPTTSRHSDPGFMSVMRQAAQELEQVDFFQPELFFGTALVVFVLIGTVSLIKSMMLAHGGGRMVALSLGGELVAPNTTDFHERQLLNVVEEMAIASGMSVPPVYLLKDESSINAFAAGFGVKDAVIGVTAGLLQKLNREQTQGVIAHEFSHILNSDTRLNIRLTGLIAGLLAISLIGRFMVHLFSEGRVGSRRREKGVTPALALVGVGLLVIGYIGVFFGRLIKSAISRQREFLADASAVQFTRNPYGLASALAFIASGSSLIRSRNAEEVSHMFFGNGMPEAWLNMMDSHPAVDVRIDRLGYQLTGGVLKTGFSHEQSSPRASSFSGAHATQKTGVGFQQIVAAVGTMLPEKGENILASLSDELRLRAETGAEVGELFKDILRNPLISGRAPQDDAEESGFILSELNLAQLYALAELCTVGVRQLGPDGYKDFRKGIFRLAREDRNVSLGEFAMIRMLTESFDVEYGFKQANIFRPQTSLSADGIRQQTARVLSLLARYGANDEAEAAQAFSEAIGEMRGMKGWQLLPAEGQPIVALDNAISALVQAPPREKKLIIEAAARCVSKDGKVTADEFNCLRCISSALGCPIPPLLG
ncbi:MAG: M48 family metallopeptidase [bacterium]|nr:M48 family metallopeptidase [bacterium]